MWYCLIPVRPRCAYSMPPRRLPRSDSRGFDCCCTDCKSGFWPKRPPAGRRRRRWPSSKSSVSRVLAAAKAIQDRTVGNRFGRAGRLPPAHTLPLCLLTRSILPLNPHHLAILGLDIKHSNRNITTRRFHKSAASLPKWHIATRSSPLALSSP